MKSTLALLVSLLSLAAHAGDVSRTEFLGFSPDGSAVGFQQYGTQDGSGFPYCTVTLVDTAKNAYIVSPASVVIESETDMPARAVCTKARAKVQSALSRLKLDSARGLRTFSRLITDGNGTGAKSVSYGTYAITPSQPRYTVSLSESDYGVPNELGIQPRILKVLLTSDHGIKVLQNDRTLPASRSGAYAYELEEGYSFETAKKSVQAFTIRYYAAGFEGPDVRTMVVTGAN